MSDILFKPQVLLLAVRNWKGVSIAGLTEGTVEELNRLHGHGLHSWGIPLEDNDEYDNKVRSAVNRLKFDVICFGGGVRMTSPAWADRTAGIIRDSLNKETKIVYTKAPQEAAPLVLEAMRDLGFGPKE